jgi:branched-chain amino acid transport system ATP-binding protein
VNASQPETLLTVENVHTFYGTIEALKGISIEVREGEIVTLIGANGAGKSTTLRSINGLNQPREGSIVFRGKDITRPPHTSSAWASAVAGRQAPLPHERGREPRDGRVPAGRSPNIREDMDRVCGLFPRLAERKNQRGMLSGGEQQMCAIGRALMARPKLLMLTSRRWASRRFVEKIFEIIGDQRAGTTILLVEQNALMALDAAQRGYVLETGRVALADDAKSLRENEQVRKTYLGET